MGIEDLRFQRQLPDRIIDKYQDNLILIEERMDEFIDPSRIPPDLIKAKLQAEMIIRNKRTDFTPEEMLKILGQLESWYLEQGFAFPNPEYLTRQRAKISADFQILAV